MVKDQRFSLPTNWLYLQAHQWDFVHICCQHVMVYCVNQTNTYIGFICYKMHENIAHISKKYNGTLHVYPDLFNAFVLST